MIKGLKNMPESHVHEYLWMLSCSYDEKEIALFQDKLQEVSKEEQEYIGRCWNDCVQDGKEG